MKKTSRLVAVREDVLPEVIVKVLRAKELKAASDELSSSEACRIVGISRSAYYKYKDSVFRYEEQSSENVLSLGLKLHDRQGVLSAVISQLYTLGMNIVKINQEQPFDSVASVSISVRRAAADGERALDGSELCDSLRAIDGVIDAKSLRA